MERHAQVVCARGGHVLNVGFGLGLVDEAIQVGNRRRIKGGGGGTLGMGAALQA